MNNKPDLTISTRVVQAPNVLKTPTMEEVIMIMTSYNIGANRTPWRVIRTGVDGSTLVTVRTRAVDGDSGTSSDFTSTTPPSGCIWKGSFGNIRQTTTPNLRKYSEFNNPIDRTLTNDSI